MSDQSPARSVPFRPNSLSFGRPAGGSPAPERTAPVRSLQNPVATPRPLPARPGIPLSSGRKPLSSPSPAAQQFLQQRIRESLVKIEQMKAKLRVLEDKRKQTLSPIYRQSADLQLNALRNQLNTLQTTYGTYRSQERAQAIASAVAAVQSVHPSQASDATSALAALRTTTTELQRHYQDAGHFPDNTGFQLLQGLIDHLQAYHDTCESHDLTTFQQLKAIAFQVLTPLEGLRFISGEEKSELSAYQEALITALEGYLLERQAKGLLEPIETPPPPEETPLQLNLQDEDEVEIRFDFKTRRASVQNQMGIALSPTKLTYQEYLDQGFACIDRVVASEFRDMSPFQSAIESFLEAVSLHKEKHEAYFGLGYLYSLVRDVNHALYFLDIAHKISGNPAIAEFMHKVKSSYGVV